MIQMLIKKLKSIELLFDEDWQFSWLSDDL